MKDKGGASLLASYSDVVVAKFVERDNRFIARCLLPKNNEEVIVHVKNTGRCRELLIPGVSVAINYQPAKSRKTDYDLIAVKKDDRWINIDSQVPNSLARDALVSGQIHLPYLSGEIIKIEREVTFGNSRFDLYLETATGQRVIVEVKGMTLANKSQAAFPDAPSERALKHVKELTALQAKGYQTYVLFVVQLAGIKQTTLYEERQPALVKAFKQAMAQGLKVIAYQCQVTKDTIDIMGEVPFQIETNFNEEEGN